MSLRKTLPGVVGMILACGMCALPVFAQEPQPQSPSAQDGTPARDRIERKEKHRERMGRREGIEGQRRMGRRGGMGHMMRELNLTEEQRQQGRAIVQRRLANTKSQREELFRLREKRIAATFSAEDEARAKVLHQEIRTSMDGIREEMEGVLTAEQKVRLEQLKQERKQKMEQRKKERQERLNTQPQ